MIRIIFTLLSGLSVIFMVYVMTQFWKEGDRSKNSSVKQHTVDPPYMDVPNVFIVTHPISHNAHRGLSVIPMDVRERAEQGESVHRNSADKIIGYL